MKAAAAFLLFLVSAAALAAEEVPDASQDILVTFENNGARRSGGAGAPYKFRKRYALSASARASARDIAKEYGLLEVDDWPIKSLDVYCFVFRLPEGAERDSVIEKLDADQRVESVQLLNRFESSLPASATYDDTYASLQHGLEQLDITGAHSYTKGRGVRIAVIDGQADAAHEDLDGRISSTQVFVDDSTSDDKQHGTAIVSVIGATANNARGIVGVAPESNIELHVACWLDESSGKSVCDTFSLAKALDAVADKPPAVLNMSLTGPPDALLARLIDEISSDGTIIVAAERIAPRDTPGFPASHDEVIGVYFSSSPSALVDEGISNIEIDAIFAPGQHIMVALPDGGYDFRSGTSIAAAHVSGVVALALSAAPDLDATAISSLLRRSQDRPASDVVSVDACKVLQLIDNSTACSPTPASMKSKLQ